MGKTAAFNPYLPFWETVPDGEPHQFGDRIYIYGSHDSLCGTTFCEEDYALWSAPADDPGNWRFDGIIYRKEQDPLNGAACGHTAAGEPIDVPAGVPIGTKEHPHFLYAPDVAQGPDGRYYLYYALDFADVISVAVADRPEGPFAFLDYVRFADGTVPSKGINFDPAILCEKASDSRTGHAGNYLYYGFAPQFRFPGQEAREIPGAMMVKLADDMHTIISEPVCVANGCDTAAGTDYEAHPFFEASSIRKIGDWYYFVYSSLQGHELCYGMAKTPEGPFAFKGVLISNGDIGLNGNTEAVCHMGNNHGGLLTLGDRTCIFWHRHTHGTQYSRQGCADEVQIRPDGTIPQTEITSCGLNGGPLPARGQYPAQIACHLTEADRTKVGMSRMAAPGEELPPLPADQPYITEEAWRYGEKGLRSMIRNLCTGAVAGYKYFAFDGTEQQVSFTLRGRGRVEMRLDTPDGEVCAACRIPEMEGKPSAGSSAEADSCSTEESSDWITVSAEMHRPLQGTHAVYFRIAEGKLDLSCFSFT
ncbi:MAG: family 43 glycosylhydrolase [Lachnospiraceae bacterium]|jgi:arabinoxylan arabinofuranohydrolase|nr:family 43 glycosylhydrolase [Lachnospiraceae bacterium]